MPPQAQMSGCRRPLRVAAVGLGMLISVPGLAACGDGGEDGSTNAGSTTTSAASGAEPGSPTDVRAIDFAFEPAESPIEVGDTVSWTNDGETIHTVKGRGFFSKAINPGQSYEFTFRKAGSYDYLCTLHPDSMTATVVVE